MIAFSYKETAMTRLHLGLAIFFASASLLSAQEPRLIAQPEAFKTLVNPMCSHCRDEAKRRASELRADDRVLCWIRGYSEGGAIPYRFFLNPYRVISDTYGVFVYDPDAGYARGFAASLDFQFHGWRNGVMVMKHKDGTLYSCLTGVAFEGPKKGEKLKAVPTLVSDWGHWLETYPQAVAYNMFDKYQPVELPTTAHPASLRSRAGAAKTGDEARVFGVVSGREARAYPLAALAKEGLIRDEIDGKTCVLLWLEKSKTAAAYRPVASPPARVKTAPRAVTLERDAKLAAAPFRDKESGSHWDIAGRAVDGAMKGWTLEWLDGVEVKQFAWSAEYPKSTSYQAKKQDAKDALTEIAGSAEFLRAVPKKFATLQSVDVGKHSVTLLIDGDKAATTWPLTPDAEIKARGWWGRLAQLETERRVWAWFKVDRAKKPVAIFMLSDELSEQEIHGGAQVKTVGKELVLVGPKKLESIFKGADKLLLDRGGEKCCEVLVLKPKDVVFVETNKGKVVKLYDADGFEALRKAQKAKLRESWVKDGLPGAIGFLHLYSGELDVILDHEAMRWARSLQPGAKVALGATPPINAVVKSVSAQREKTQIRLVVKSLDLADLNMGQRVHLKMPAPSAEVESSLVPPDIDRPRTREERIDWFLANIYCTCGVAGDTCTGHFYSLASCNPNSCAAPNQTRQTIGKHIDAGWTNREIFDALLKQRGPTMLRPHLLP